MSAPSPQPLLASLLPVSPDNKLLFWNGTASVGLSPQEVQGILKRARSGDFDLNRSDIPEITALRILALAIDQETGDSVVHIAAASTGEPLGVQRVIAQTNQRTCGLDRSQVPRQLALESILMHQNYAGDSCLHVAARDGLQIAVTFLYRVFCFPRLRSGAGLASPPQDDDDGSLSEFDRGEDLIDDNQCAKRLAFLLLPNAAGQTAAVAARSAGHVETAGWLENIIMLLDPTGVFVAHNIPEVIEEARWRHGLEEDVIQAMLD